MGAHGAWKLAPGGRERAPGAGDRGAVRGPRAGPAGAAAPRPGHRRRARAHPQVVPAPEGDRPLYRDIAAIDGLITSDCLRAAALANLPG